MGDSSRIIKNASLLFVGSVIADVGAFLFRTLIAQEFGPSQFGQFSLALVTVTVTTSIALLGLPDGLVTFISRFRENDHPGKIIGVLAISAVFILTLSFSFFIILWVASPWIAHTVFNTPELTTIVRTFAWAVPAKAIIAATAAICLGYERGGLQSLIKRIFPKVGALIVVISVIYLGDGLETVVRWYVATLWITAIFGITISYSFTKEYSINGVSTNPEELLSFSTPLFLSRFIGIFLNWADTILIGYFLTSASVGIYQSAFILATTVSVFQNVVGNSLYPDFSSLLENNQHGLLRERYQSAIRWMIILTTPPTIYLVFFSSSSLSLIFGVGFSSGNKALMIIVVGQLIVAAIGPATATLKSMGNSRYIFKTYLYSLFLNVTLNILLIPKIGLAGAALGTASGTILSNLLHYKKVNDKYEISIATRDISIVCLMAVSVALILKVSIGGVGNLLTFGAHILLFSFLYSIGLFYIGLVEISDIQRFISSVYKS